MYMPVLSTTVHYTHYSHLANTTLFQKLTLWALNLLHVFDMFVYEYVGGPVICHYCSLTLACVPSEVYTREITTRGIMMHV